MQIIKQQLVTEINQILKGIKIDTSLITDPPRIELGEFALPCFLIAKEMKTKPAKAAEILAEDLQKQGSRLWDKISIEGPYINFHLKKDIWNKAVLTGEFFQKPAKQAKRKKIMLEYSQPNTHKQFHVGHLRNACLGASLVKIFKFLKHKVIAATYVNDVGLHVAQCLWNYMHAHLEDKLPANKGKFLAEVYAESVAKIDDNEQLKAQVSQVLQDLENKDKALMKLWQETRDWSLSEFKQIYSELNIEFDQWYYESDYVEKAKKIVKKLIKQKIAKQSQGAIVADLKKYDLDILVLLKSDGNTLYSTTDLALAFEKAKKNLDSSLYLVDVRQSLYFKQLFQVLQLAGLKEQLIHIPYEFVKLPQGAMSSRQGNVIAYEDFRDTLLDYSASQTKQKHPDWPEDKINKVAFGLAMAAIKFGMLKYENNSIVIFDPDAALSFEGASGPYLLYTVARINSILKKVQLPQSAVDFSLLKEIEEQVLIKHLSQFDQIVELCAKNYQSSYLITYLLELAQKFNAFYHQYSVIKAVPDIQAARIILVQSSLEKLKLGLQLLNIEPLEEM